MKVKDLIEILLKLNPEAEILPSTDNTNLNLKQRFNYYDDKGWIEETPNPYDDSTY